MSFHDDHDPARLFEDTDPRIEQQLVALLRATPGPRKLRMWSELTASMVTVYEAGLRRRHPGEAPGELARLRVQAWYGVDLDAAATKASTATQ